MCWGISKGTGSLYFLLYFIARRLDNSLEEVEVRRAIELESIPCSCGDEVSCAFSKS